MPARWFPTAWKVIGFRSQLVSKMAGQGAVALVELDAEAAEARSSDRRTFRGEHRQLLSPRQTVIAGPPDQVDAVIAHCCPGPLRAGSLMEVASHRLHGSILPELRSASDPGV